MRDITLDEIQKKFDSLPESLKLAIIIAGADKKINSIGRENGLNINQISELLLKTHIMMFGFIHPDLFENSIKEIENIPPRVVRAIVRDVNEQIIKDIRDDLIILSQKKEEVEDIEGVVKNEETERVEIEKPLEGVEGVEISGIKETELNKIILNKEIRDDKEINDIKNTEILMSAGVEIDTPTFKKEDLIQNEINNILNREEDNEKNKEVLLSAGIDIDTNNFLDKTPQKTEQVYLNNFSENEIKKNDEIMKIAFEELPEEEKPFSEEYIEKEEPSVLKEEKDTVKGYGLDEKIQLQVSNKNKEISAPIEPVLISSPVELIGIEGDAGKEIFPRQEEDLELEKAKEIKEDIVKIKQEIKEEDTKMEEVHDGSKHEAEKIDATVNSDKNLKTAIQDIIDSYKNKEKEETITKENTVQYSINSSQKNEDEIEIKNNEKNKDTIILEIVEVQNKMKIMKDRIAEIEKEKVKIEKERLLNKDTENSSKDPRLSELYLEEKNIQKIREHDLPIEYLDLLEKLDKITNHKKNTNPLKNEHK